MRGLSTRALVFSLAVLLTALALSIACTRFVSRSSFFSYYVERVQMAVDPSPERAFTYGMRHFNPTLYPDLYQIDEAAYFLQRAIDLDSTYPGARQQLARIYFIKGNFKTALVLINDEMALESTVNASAYYVRGLIEGFNGDYTAAAADFEHFITLRPDTWAAYNDLSWVLMKGGENERARDVLAKALERFPDNAWLLNSYAIALYETGDREAARSAAERARDAVALLTPDDWASVNPGNDPRIAPDGLEGFRAATLSNLQTIIASTNPAESVGE